MQYVLLRQDCICEFEGDNICRWKAVGINTFLLLNYILKLKGQTALNLP